MPRRFTCPPYLRPLLVLFSSHGERAYPVGGCVRDTLMGIKPHDWDVAVTTAPERTVEICHVAGYRTIPTGLKHGTVTVIVPHSGDPADRESSYDLIECTTCRTEGGYSDGRHPDAVSFTGRIEDDLSRRDFTVNAMAFDGDGESLAVLDLFGGREDLQSGIIRAVGDPDTRFTEDALRLMRAVRFAVKLGFSVEENTFAAMGRCADGLARISRERISEEFQKILTSPEPERGISLLTQTGLLPYVLPCGISPRGANGLSVLPAEFTLRMAALSWGMAGDAVEKNLAGLRLSNAVRKDILTITQSASAEIEATPSFARRWRHELGDLAQSALAVRLACAEADTAEIGALVELVGISIEQKEPVRISDLAVSGNDLIALGFKPGKILQEILWELLTVVWEAPEKNTYESLIVLIKERQKREN